MNKTIVITILLIILAGFLFWGFQTDFFSKIFPGPVKPVAVPEGIILFYGEGCSHCKIVDDFISQNKIADKVKLTHLEVWYNKDNQTILGEVAPKCGITSSQIGVPLLYDPARLGEAGGNNKCYTGDVDVINFLKNAANIK